MPEFKPRNIFTVFVNNRNIIFDGRTIELLGESDSFQFYCNTLREGFIKIKDCWDKIRFVKYNDKEISLVHNIQDFKEVDI